MNRLWVPSVLISHVCLFSTFKLVFTAYFSSFLKEHLLVAQIIASHIEKCRSRRFLRNAWAVVIPEANLPTIAQNIMNAVRELKVPRCIFMTEDNDKGSAYQYDLPGSITTRRSKPQMVTLLIEDYMKKQRLVFYHDFIVAEWEYAVVDNIKNEFIKQMRGFLKKKKAMRQRDGTILYETFYSGKHNGQNDDFVLTLMIGIFMRERFFKNEKYRPYWYS